MATSRDSTFVEDYSSNELIPLEEAGKSDIDLIEKAELRADRLGKYGKKCLGPLYPGYFDAYMTIRPLLVRLTTMSTQGAYRSFKMISQLQRVCCEPYLPRSIVNYTQKSPKTTGPTNKSFTESVNMPKAKLLPADDKNRTGVMRTCAILSSAVYPASSVTEHRMKKVKSSGSWTNTKYRIEQLVKSVSVVDYVDDEKVCKPAYAVCVDYKNHVCYVVIRGSSAPEDFVTDMMCDPIDSGLGPHRGMAMSADYIDSRVRKRVVEFVSKTPGSSVVLTGHSLGAGTAALLTTKWIKDESMSAVTLRLQCIAIACPAILNEHDPFVNNPQIKVIVFGKDIVPRLSFGSFRDLLVQMKCLADLESQEGDLGVDDVSSAISHMTPATAASTPSTGSRSLSTFDSDSDNEWKKLPEGIPRYKKTGSESVLLTDVNFAGLTEAEKKEQNRALAAQLKHCKISFGGASFNQVNGLLKKKIKILDKERASLMKNPQAAKLQPPGNRFKRWLIKLGWKIVKFCAGGRMCCKATTASIKAKNEAEESVFLKDCLKEIYSLRCKTTTRFLTPPGQIYMCIPRLHMVEQHIKPPQTGRVLLGQCYIFEVDRTEFSETSMMPVWSVGALNQHKMECYLQALAPDMVKSFPLEAILSQESQTLKPVANKGQ